MINLQILPGKWVVETLSVVHGRLWMNDLSRLQPVQKNTDKLKKIY